MASPQNTAYLQSGPHTYNTSGKGREYWTLGRGNAARFQSGPHHQQSRKQPRTPDVLDDNSQAWHLRAVMQGGGTCYLNQLVCIQWGTMLHNQYIGNIGILIFDRAALIFPFQHWAEYAPVNPMCVQSITHTNFVNPLALLA